MKMKAMKIVTLLTAIVLCVAFASVSVFADNAVLKSVGGSVEVDGTNKSTVSVSISASTDMVLQLIQGVFSPTEIEGTGYFKLVDISSDQIVFDGVNYAYDVNTGELVWMDDSYNGLSFAQDAPVLVATYEVAANTPAGTYTVGFENEVIADGDWNEYYDHFTFTIEVKESAPACEHTETKLVSNGNLTHKVVCANEECKYVLNEEKQCVATNDGDCTTDDKCECGYVITSARDAHVPEEDDGDCTTPVKCVYCDYVVTEAQAHAFNNKPSDILKDGAGCENAAQYYVQCDNCNEVNFEKTVEVGDPRGHGTLNGFRLDPNSDGTHNVVCNDCSEATEENVKCTVDDTKTTYGEASPAQCCVAGDAYKYTSCECGYGFEAEEVKGYYPATKEHILNKIEKVPNCKDVGYSAYWECTVMCYHFSDEAGTQRIDDLSAWIDVGGEGYRPVDPTNHYLDTVYYIYNDDAHSSYYDCCNTPVVTDAPHEVDPDTHECFCGFVEHVCEHSKYETTETTHKSICACGAPVGDAEPHDFNNDAHTCVCGAVEKHVITLNANGGKFPNDAPEYSIGSIYGDFFNAFDAPARDGYNFIGWNTKADGSGDHFDPAEYRFTEDVTVYAQWDAAHSCTHDHYDIAEGTHQSICSCGKAIGNPVSHSYTDGACFCGAKFTGWDGDYYYVEAVLQKTGWTEIEDSWYYLDTETGKRAEGWTRVPYPEFAIEGNTYAPNQEDIDYAASNGIAFIDATEAWFLFDDDYGIFAYNLTGVLTIGENMSYVVNGMIPWHPGYIEIDPENNDFCYFVGDTENGGNKTAEGLLYATRGIEPGKYYFINWGRVDEIVGVQYIDGVLYYFDADHKIAMGAGLIKIEEGKYIYVRSNGMLAQNQYYIPMGLELASGMYQIDDNGFIIDPVSSDKNGIHDGYYYENGKLAYAGLIEIDGAIYYIKSNGQVATGEYYVTKISAELADTYSAGDKLIFGEDGKMESVKNGIVLEDGNYYFYENNHIMYGAGVIEIEEGVYIYVRSNGQLATGEYWPAKTNGLLEIGKYDWGTDGKYYAD